jgi:hypothetical protein
MALGSTQPLTEMSTRSLPGGKGRPARKVDNLTAICELTVYKMCETRRLMGLHVLSQGQLDVTNGSKTAAMDVIGFLYISLGSSKVELHDSVGCARACSEAGFISQNGDRA